MTAVLAGFFIVVGALGVVVAAAILEGWVLSVVWSWFAVPIFALPTITIPQGIGIALLIGLLTKQYVPQKDKDRGIWTWIVLRPLVVLTAAWIALKFV